MIFDRLIIIVLVSFLGLAANAHSDLVATYAALLPLTGNGSDQAEWCRHGLELAAKEISSKNSEIELIFEDTHGDPKTALSIFQNITSQRKLSGVLTWGSGVAMALSPIANQKRIIQMGIATATPSYSSFGDFNFRVFPSANDESIFVNHELSSRYPDARVSSIYIQNDYGVGTVEALRKQLLQSKKDFVLAEPYNPGETDFRSTLLKIKSMKPDIVHVAAYPSDGALILKQARDIGLHPIFLSSVAIAGGNEFLSLAGSSANGLMVISSVPNQKNLFFKLYRESFGDGPITLQLYAARAFDALNILDQAQRKCGGKSDCMRDTLFDVKNFDGASGNISFDEAGDSKFAFQLYRVEDGKLIVEK